MHPSLESHDLKSADGASHGEYRQLWGVELQVQRPACGGGSSNIGPNLEGALAPVTVGFFIRVRQQRLLVRAAKAGEKLKIPLGVNLARVRRRRVAGPGRMPRPDAVASAADPDS